MEMTATAIYNLVRQAAAQAGLDLKDGDVAKIAKQAETLFVQTEKKAAEGVVLPKVAP